MCISMCVCGYGFSYIVFGACCAKYVWVCAWLQRQRCHCCLRDTHRSALRMLENMVGPDWVWLFVRTWYVIIWSCPILLISSRFFKWVLPVHVSAKLHAMVVGLNLEGLWIAHFQGIQQDPLLNGSCKKSFNFMHLFISTKVLFVSTLTFKLTN